MASQLFVVAATFLVAFFGLEAAGIAYTGPLAVLAGLGAVVATQRRKPDAWASIGLGHPGPAGRFVAHVLLGLLAGWCAAIAGTLLARGLGWAPIDTARFAGLHGNAPMLLGMLAISWTTAALGEEVLFRGFLQARLRALFGRFRHAGVLAAVGQAVLFGLAHAYQGATGILATGAVGLAFGLLMLRFRSVWPLVVAHGLIDTVSMVALYAGARPA